MAAGFSPFLADEPIQVYEKIVAGKVEQCLHIHNAISILYIDYYAT